MKFRDTVPWLINQKSKRNVTQRTVPIKELNLVLRQSQTVRKVPGIRIFASWLFCTNFVSLNIGKTDVVGPAKTQDPDKNDGGLLTGQSATSETGHNQAALEMHDDEWSSENRRILDRERSAIRFNEEEYLGKIELRASLA